MNLKELQCRALHAVRKDEGYLELCNSPAVAQSDVGDLERLLVRLERAAYMFCDALRYRDLEPCRTSCPDDGRTRSATDHHVRSE